MYLEEDLGVHCGHGAVVEHHAAAAAAPHDDGLGLRLRVLDVPARPAAKVESELGVEEARVGVVPRHHHDGQVRPLGVHFEQRGLGAVSLLEGRLVGPAADLARRRAAACDANHLRAVAVHARLVPLLQTGHVQVARVAAAVAGRHERVLRRVVRLVAHVADEALSIREAQALAEGRRVGAGGVGPLRHGLGGGHGLLERARLELGGAVVGEVVFVHGQRGHVVGRVEGQALVLEKLRGRGEGAEEGAVGG